MTHPYNGDRVRVLIIGGTGQISAALTHLLVATGYHVTLLNRGERKVNIPPSVNSVRGTVTRTESLLA
jgi:uncharacterized protein YbjT (DUF2867 family)